MTFTGDSCKIVIKNKKEMLSVDDIDDKEFLAKLFNAMYEELPLPKEKKIETAPKTDGRHRTKG